MERDFDSRKEAEAYITGFCDAESCFSVAIKKNSTSRLGYRLDAIFQVTQHQENEEILHMIQDFLGCGKVQSKPGNNDLSILMVRNRQDLIQKVVPFFESNPLITKSEDFEKFREVIQKLEEGVHDDEAGLIHVVKLAYSMNMDGKQRRRALDNLIEDIRRE